MNLFKLVESKLYELKLKKPKDKVGEKLEEKNADNKEEANSDEKSKVQDETSSTSVLEEVLSPWRAAKKHHVESCRAKYIEMFGRDIHLHSDDSDTMIKLKERITPSCAQVREKQQINKKHKKISKAVPSAFDEWVQNKNQELKKKKEKKQVNKTIKATEAKKAITRNDNVEKWMSNRDYLEKEKRAIEKIKERYKDEIEYDTNDSDEKMNKIPASDWEQIRQAAEDMQHTEPLLLGKLDGQGFADPGKYLTKYVVKPDPAFRARYKHILEAAAARPSELILDGENNESIEDPAELPPQILQMLKGIFGI